MNLTILITLCVAITTALIVFPLLISYKAEKSKKESEWDKIASYGKDINKKSRNKKLH
jgi:H+/gluconate symporter-like permease